MAFVEFAVRVCGTVDHCLVVAEEVTIGSNGHAKVTEGVSKINDLFRCCPCCDDLGSEGGRLHGPLLLAVPVYRGLVSEVQYSGHGLPSQYIVHEVRIDVMCELHELSQWRRSIFREFLSGTVIH